MQVGNANLTVGRFERHLVARKYKKSRAKRILVVGLLLTSMVDMFSLLVIFLLQTFSNSPEVVTLSKSVRLPVAMSSVGLKDAPVLAVTKDEVFLDQKSVGVTDQILAKPQLLIEGLQGLRDMWAKNHPNDTFKGDILLQADKEIPSTQISHVINVLISQGYGSVQLAAVSGGR